MNRFEIPEIKVVKFATPDILTLSAGGYADNDTIKDWSYNNISGGEDGDIPL